MAETNRQFMEDHQNLFLQDQVQDLDYLARQARIILRISHDLIAERKKTEHLESALATQARKDANMRLTNNLIAERKKTEHLLHSIGMFRSQRNADQAEMPNFANANPHVARRPRKN
jgi:hypothetical protein